MAQFINNWASGLIVAVIIATIVELILPENKNKKYVKMVSGIFILFTIISPVIMKFTGDINLDIEKYADMLTPENTIESQETASVITDKNIMKVYKENLAKNIKTGIENLNYTVKSIELDIDEDKNYGDIKKIYLQVENVKLISDINIEDIEIDVSVGEKTIEGQGVGEETNGEQLIKDQQENENQQKNNTSSQKTSQNKIRENDKNIIKEFLNKNYRIPSRDIYIN